MLNKKYLKTFGFFNFGLGVRVILLGINKLQYIQNISTVIMCYTPIMYIDDKTPERWSTNGRMQANYKRRESPTSALSSRSIIFGRNTLN